MIMKFDLRLPRGDQASIVGRRMGTHRWSPSTFKTIEGSLAFVASIVACAWALRMLGYAETFSVRIYIFETPFLLLFTLGL